MKTYRVHLLRDDEFDSLGYDATRGSDVSASLGFANKYTGDAYVRYTAWPDLNQYLIEHELEELEADSSTHEDENGIRHKGFGNVVRSVAQVALPTAAQFFGLGPVGVGAAGALGGALGGGGLSGALRGGLTAGIGQGAGALVPGAAKVFTAAPGISRFIPGAVSNAGLKAGTTSLSSFGPQNVFSGFLKNIGNALTGKSTPTVSTTGAGGALQASTSFKDAASNFLKDPKKLAGALSTAVGLFKGYPDVPESGDVDALRSQLQSGGGPLGQAGAAALQGQLNQQFDPLSDAEITALNRQFDIDEQRELDSVRDLYRNLRPGTDPSTDNTFRRDIQEVKDKYARARADAVAGRTRDIQGIYNQQRLAQIQTALGADNAQMQQLQNIAQLDIERIMTQLKLDAQQAQTFKDTFLGIGGALLSSPAADPFDDVLKQAVLNFFNP